MTKFAQKFENLQNLVVTFWDRCDVRVCLILKLLKSVIVKNKTKIQIKASHYVSSDEYIILNKTIKENGLQIEKMEIAVGDTYSPFGYIKKAISNQGLAHLRVENWQSGGSNLGIIINFLKKFEESSTANESKDEGGNEIEKNEVAFKALKILEIEDFDALFSSCSNMTLINDFLNLQFIIDKKLFVITSFKAPPKKAKGDFISLFDTLCKSVSRLLTKERIPIDIKVLFENLEDEPMCAESKKMFQSYFDEEKLVKNYKQPQCNKYCKPLMNPFASFTTAGESDTYSYHDNGMIFRVTNVERCYQV